MVDDEKQDRYLGDKLKTEYGRILWWCIEGAMKWYKDGIAQPEDVASAVKEYKSEMDLVQKWIIENCETDILYSESATGVIYEYL